MALLLHSQMFARRATLAVCLTHARVRLDAMQRGKNESKVRLVADVWVEALLRILRDPPMLETSTV